MNRAFLLVFALALAEPAFPADPFIGTWKLNQSKSDYKGQRQTITDLGNNKYRFLFGSNIDFTITADGTDQASFPGESMAITIKDSHTWRVVGKSNGVKVTDGLWTLSSDANTVSNETKVFRQDGTTSEAHLAAKRVAGSGGFAGTWELQDATQSGVTVLQITPYGQGGLSINDSAFKFTVNLTMDGKDCPHLGPTVPTGSVSSAKRGSERSFQSTYKMNGKVMSTSDWSVSGDGKTLTITDHLPGEEKAPMSYFERQ